MKKIIIIFINLTFTLAVILGIYGVLSAGQGNKAPEFYESEVIEPGEELFPEELDQAELDFVEYEAPELYELEVIDPGEELPTEEFDPAELETATEPAELNEDLQQPPFTGYTLPNGAIRDLQDDSVNRNCRCDEIHCVECQYERLRELLRWELNDFSLDDAPLNIPRVNLIFKPTGLEKYFTIGLVDEPTPECIDFILAHTGIPRELARISKATLSRGNVFIPKYPEDDVPSLQEKCEESLQDIAPLSTMLRIGELFSIEGFTGRATVGHPINSLGDSFATSLHRTDLEGRRVYKHGTNIHIGYIGQSYFEPHRDVAIVKLIGSNRVLPLIDGGQIDSYMEDYSVGQPVISARGVSGTQYSLNVDVRNATGRFPEDDFDFFNKIAVRPTGEYIRGDSGAALISRSAPNDRAVLGTLAGVTYVDGELAAIYTSVMNYSPFLVGDLDGDGRVTSADATALARWLAGHNVEIALCASNITCKPGTLPDPYIADLTRLSRWLVGHFDRCPNGLFCAVCKKEILF